MAVIRNSTHYGIAGYLAMMAEKAGMLGITGTNARPSIAPTVGIENKMGTNPLTFAELAGYKGYGYAAFCCYL